MRKLILILLLVSNATMTMESSFADPDPIKLLSLHEDRIETAVFNKDGTQILTTSASGVKLWDAQNGELIKELHHEGSVYSASFSPDEQCILTVSGRPVRNVQANIWSINSGELLYRMHGHTGSVISASFSPNGKLIVSFE